MKRTPEPPEPPTRSVGGILDVALEISKRRAASLRQIKRALQAGDNDTAIKLMRYHVGLDNAPGDLAAAQGVDDPDDEAR